MKIVKEDLLFQIQTILKDELVAKITETDGTLILQFENGQSFMVRIEEKQ